MAKDQVNQEFYEVKRAMEREDEEHDMRVSEVQKHLGVLDYKITELS